MVLAQSVDAERELDQSLFGRANAPSAPVEGVESLMRSLDWAGSPLGDPAGWPTSLRTVVDLMLGSKFPMFIAWGPELGLIYNEAYTELLGDKHPAALGARFEDVWGEIWTDLTPLIATALSGEAVYRDDLPLLIRRHGFDEEAWFTFSYSPVRDESGEVAGMFCAVAETTPKVRSERRQAFRLKLDDALAGLTEPEAVMDAAVDALGRHLGAQRVGYSQVLPDDAALLFRACYADGVAPLTGVFPLDDFGPENIARQRTGATEVWDDVQSDPGQRQEVWAALETRAFISVPLVRGGRLRGTLYVNFREPRRWSRDDVALVEHVAARTWDAVERARAERGLRESEARFRIAAELSPDALVISRNRTFVYANAAAARLYGVADPSALVGLSSMAFNAPGQEAKVEARLKRVWAGERVEPMELDIVRADGSPITVDVSAAPITWSGEQALEVLMRDATERKAAEAALRESEARFRNMADHAPMMMWVTDEAGACTYLNRRWYEFTGQAADEALGYGWLDATHPDDKAMTEQIFRTANANQAIFRVEYRLRQADGTYRWAIDAAAPRFGEDGEFLGYVGSVIDIQDRREAEERLRQNEARLQSLMNAMPAFVWLADSAGDIHYFNDRWYAFTGQTPDQAMSGGWADTLHPDDVARTLKHWSQSLAQGLEYEIDVRYRRADGIYRWYLARAEPVRDPEGRITAWLGASIDIHENRLAADHQQLLINELNHRVKNTLATVQSMAAQTVRSGADPQRAQEAFTSRLMALSSAHNVLTEQRWAGAELHEVVEGAARTFSDLPDHRFVTRGPPVWLPPKAALALSMALHELGTNASKYGSLSTPEGSVLLEWSAPRAGHGRRLELAWREQDGPPVSPPDRKGFGSRLLERGLAAELGGAVTLEFRPEGLVCRIEADLDPAG